MNLENGTVTVRGVSIGAGIPKICIPVMGHNTQEVLLSAESALACTPDVVEWRVDWLEDLSMENLLSILNELRSRFPATPLLATFRTKKEGGERALDAPEYAALLEGLCASGNIDLVDMELFTGDSVVDGVLRCAHQNGVAVIGSSHDFQQTPDEAEMIRRLERMQTLGCDIAKLAVMPRSPRDVLALLSATEKVKSKYPELPLITMSMGQLGMVSRLCGQVFGSALTFGSAGQASAPGQVAAPQLREILMLLEQ